MITEKKKGKNGNFFDIEQKIKSSLKSGTTKLLLDFNCLGSLLIRSFVVKKKKKKATTQR